MASLFAKIVFWKINPKKSKNENILETIMGFGNVAA